MDTNYIFSIYLDALIMVSPSENGTILIYGRDAVPEDCICLARQRGLNAHYIKRQVDLIQSLRNDNNIAMIVIYCPRLSAKILSELSVSCRRSNKLLVLHIETGVYFDERSEQAFLKTNPVLVVASEGVDSMTIDKIARQTICESITQSTPAVEADQANQK